MNWQQRMDAVLMAFRQHNQPRRSTIRLGDIELDVLVAETPTQWRQGLIDQSLDDVDGMLFVMPPGSTYEFHMRGMYLSLTVLFFDELGQVVDMALLEPPDGHKAPVPYTYALELPSTAHPHRSRPAHVVTAAVTHGLQLVT